MHPQWQQLAEGLTGLLGLQHPPVAITFHEERPEDALPWFDHPMSEPTPDGRSGRVAAGCVFWVHGHQSSFHTAPPDHGNCSVGRFTHGLAAAEEIIGNADVASLLEVGWVTLDDFAGVAALGFRPAAITYGPLSEAWQPDVVLLRLSPRQMMALADATPEVRFAGKPQCQILPLAASGVIAASMGCALSRVRTGMGDDELTCALPAERVAEVVERLQAVTVADRAVEGYAATDAARF